MKFSTVLAALTAMFVVATNASAQQMYFGLQGQVVNLNDATIDYGPAYYPIEISFDTGFGVGAVLGQHLNESFRVESELMYRTNEIDGATGTASVSSLAVMFNGWKDFDGGAVKPYIGGGIGFSTVFAAVDYVVDDSDTVFAYQIGGGVGFPLQQNVTLSLDYRFFGTSAPEFTDMYGDRFETEYNSHNFGVALRFFL